MRQIVLLCAGLLVASSAFGASDHSEQINYQGKLVQGTSLVNGVVSMTLRLYTNSAGGTALYEETNAVTVVDGYYTFMIGKHPNYGQLKKVAALGNIHVEITINGQTLTPREPLSEPPYASSVDEDSLIASTDFLYRMVVKHEMEMAKILEYPEETTTIPGNYFLDTFQNNVFENRTGDRMGYVDITNSTSFFWQSGGWSACGSIAALSSAVVVTGNQDHVLVGTFSNINAIVDVVSYDAVALGRGSFPPVEPAVYVRFNYSDMTTSEDTNGNFYSDFRYNAVFNPHPEKMVSTIELFADSRVFGPGQDRTEIGTFHVHATGGGSEPADLVVRLPFFTNKLTHAAVAVVLANRVPGDFCDFSLSDGTQSVTGLTLDTKCELDMFTNNPTLLTIHLHPGTTSNTTESTRLESYFFKWWD